MKTRILLPALAALGLITVLAGDGPQAQTPPPLPQPPAQPAPPENGVEPLPRGPVHEAFAQPDMVNPQPGPIVAKRPPDAIDEMPPDQKPEGDNVVWIPGYWAWEDDAADFIWVSGFWRDVPPDHQWVPGYWVAAESGYQWTPGYWGQVGLQEVSYQPPPPQSLETGPSVAAPQENMIYNPGIWIYRQARYFWRPGFWMTANPNWIYVPARYLWTPAGCVFVDGYWDYPLARRGVLFSPVRLAPALMAQPNFFYQPNYVVSTPALFTSLFVATDFHRYQFGDYFGPQYVQRGVVPWYGYQSARGVVAPLFAHYRWQNRGDRAWATNLARLYTERSSGLAPRPAATLVQQNQLIQNITVNKNVVINNKTVAVANPQALVQNLQVVAPLKQATQINNVKLRPVTKTALVRERQAVTQIRTSAGKRRDVETKLVAEGHRPTRPTDPARTAKLWLPPVTRPAAPAAKVQAPPAPRVPAHVERPLPKHEPVAPKRIPARPEVKTPPPPRPDPKAKTPPRPEVKAPPPPRPEPKAKTPPPRPEPKAKTPPPPPRPEAKAPVPTPRPAAKAPPRVEARPPAPQPKQAPHVVPPSPHPTAKPAAQPPHQAPAAKPAAQPPHPAPATLPHAKPQPPPHPAPQPKPAPAPAAHPQPPRPAPAPAAHPQPPRPVPPPAVRPQPQPRPAPPPPREKLPHPKDGHPGHP